MHLVLIETSGNQDFIFGTNRLAENVGASQLLFECSVQLVQQVAEQLPVEEVTVSSGRAMLVAADQSTADELIWRVTVEALRRAPGVQLTGLSVAFEPGGLQAAVSEIGAAYSSARATLAGSATRFLRLPPIASCAGSPFPAARFETRNSNEQAEPRSLVSIAKQGAAKAGVERMRDTLEASKDRLASNVQELEVLSKDRWLAVVHIDGNGIGKLFRGITAGSDEAYREQLQRYSKGVHLAAETALKKAAASLPARNSQEAIRFIPLVYGGDDATFVCDGGDALAATVAYQQEFEAQTSQQLGRRLGSKAGVAIVKPHYPFSAAYQLAESLAASAGKVKQEMGDEASAIDFHVLHDASGASLRQIRQRMSASANRARLSAGPYVVSEIDRDTPQWAQRRLWSALRARVGALQATNDKGRRSLPPTQVHALREALYRSTSEANRVFKLQCARYPTMVELGHGGSLFWEEGEDGETIEVSPALDAMMADDFLQVAM